MNEHLPLNISSRNNFIEDRIQVNARYTISVVVGHVLLGSVDRRVMRGFIYLIGSMNDEL